MSKAAKTTMWIIALIVSFVYAYGTGYNHALNKRLLERDILQICKNTIDYGLQKAIDERK